MRRFPKFKHKKQTSTEFLESTLRMVAAENGRCVLPVAAVAAIEPILALNELSPNDKLLAIKVVLGIMRRLEQDETLPMGIDYKEDKP